MGSIEGVSHLKTSKAVGIVVAIVQVASLAAFGLSLHTLSSVLMMTLSEQNMSFEMIFDEATGTAQLQFDITTGNQGFLSADLTLQISAIDPDGVRYARESSAANIAPGAVEPIALTLHIPSSEVERMIEEGRGSELEILITLRTLNGLTGFSNTLRIEGGEFG